MNTKTVEAALSELERTTGFNADKLRNFYARMNSKPKKPRWEVYFRQRPSQTNRNILAAIYLEAEGVQRISDNQVEADGILIDLPGEIAGIRRILDVNLKPTSI